MPGSRVHAFVDRVLFGRGYWRIHREMDKPYLYLGKYHRVLFHDPLCAYVIARKQYPNDPNAIAAAQCHIALDNLCSRERGLKKALERLATLDKKKKRDTKPTSETPREGVTETWSDRLAHLIDLARANTHAQRVPDQNSYDNWTGLLGSTNLTRANASIVARQRGMEQSFWRLQQHAVCHQTVQRYAAPGT